MVKKITRVITYLCLVTAMMMAIAGCDAGRSKANLAYIEALEYQDNEQYEECLQSLDKALKLGYEERIIYDDIGYTYILMEEYETALKYLHKAEAIQSLDESLCTDLGIAYYHLGRYEDAIEKSMTALEFNNNNLAALSVIGTAHMQLGNYAEAMKYMRSYLTYEPGDYEAKRELTYCYINQGRLLDAYNYINQVTIDHSDIYEAFDVKGYVMEQLDSSDNIESYYMEVRDKFPDEIDAWLNLGMYYYNKNLYRESVAEFEDVYKRYPMKSVVSRWLSMAYSQVREVDKAIEFAQMAIDLEPDSLNNNNMGNILYEQTRYLESIPYYRKAVKKDTEHDDTYSVNLMYAHMLAKQYQQAIDYGKSILTKYKDSYEVPKIIGLAYFEKNIFNEAVAYFIKAEDRGIPEKDISLLLARGYYHLGNYDEAKKYIQKCLDDNLDDEAAMELKESINLVEGDSTKLIQTIVEDYYLYYKENQESGTTSNSVDTEKLFKSLIKRDDPYSYYIYGDLYDNLINNKTSSIDFQEIDDKTILINIRFFNADTDHIFTEYIDTIENPESKTLMINVMDNGGGHTVSTVNMLDRLLPAVTVCTLIDRLGTTYPYYTSASKIDFNHIYVFINKNSASASELMTLALDTYLDNVTIVGERSHGKGVGQYVFDNPNKKEAYFIVNHYWNVREINIMDVGVKPDIKVMNPTIKKIFKAIGR